MSVAVTDLLLIGYGNDLRGDDALGPLLAAAVMDQHWPGVVAVAVHQLNPELAAMLASAQRVIFADACVANEVSLEPISLLPQQAAWSGHVSNPGELLALTTALYGTTPRGWQLVMAAQQFELGAALSPRAQASLQTALAIVERFVATPAE